jgi:hypothetical protein
MDYVGAINRMKYNYLRFLYLVRPRRRREGLGLGSGFFVGLKMKKTTGNKNALTLFKL